MRATFSLKLLSIRLLATALAFSISSSDCFAQTLRDVLSSEPYRQVAGGSDGSTSKGEIQRGPRAPYTSPRTNYDLLWHTDKSGKYLLEWIGVRNVRGRLAINTISANKEFAQARVALTNSKGVRVDLIIQVPRPEYMTMAEYRTLQSFNRYRPPALDVIADQTLPLQGMEAKHYRLRDGSCSLLFDMAKHGIVTLFTQRCSDSPDMIAFTKALNFERLNSKLDS